MIALDSSVVIAAFATWHEEHPAAVKALARKPRLIAHAALEVYSVLTRLPAPHRVPGPMVRRFLDDRFQEPLLTLPEARHRKLLSLLADRQILGGQVYDALIGFTAAEHEATLISFDRRASVIYESVGVSVQHPG